VEKVEITVVGAGVIGLAVAQELTKITEDLLVIERHFSFGQETSSRNSEVIHAGIYYPKNSLKAITCFEGKNLLYEFCRKHNVDCKQTGKLIIAETDAQIKELEDISRNAAENKVEDLELIDKKKLKQLEPHVEAKAALYSPSTGIIDSHGLMKHLSWMVQSRNGQIAYNTELIGIEKAKDGYILHVQDEKRETFSFFSRLVVNSAGLSSDKIAAMVGNDKKEYRLHYCKGDYFRVHNNKGKFISRLVYPVPKLKKAGLGTHATLDLGGGLRLGPDDQYVNDINYTIDESKRKAFYESVRGFLPFIEPDDLHPDTSGIRPKLQGPDDDFRDFLVQDEISSGFEGFVNLIGIESPGITAALSIARYIKDISAKYF